MNYARIYNSLINRTSLRNIEGYSESHHIVPRCMGGNDDPSNLVELTPEEHFLAHQLLVKMYPRNLSLVRAANMMTRGCKGLHVRNNKQFGWLRRLNSIAVSATHKGKVVSEESRKKMSDSQKGKTISDEVRKKISDSLRGRKRGPCSESTKEKIGNGNRGKVRTEEEKKVRSKRMKERYASPEERAKQSERSKGRKQSQETKDKIAAARRARVTSGGIKVQSPVCVLCLDFL